MESSNELKTNNLLSTIKDDLNRILKSEVFDSQDSMKRQIESIDFTRGLAELIWNTKELMNCLEMLAPYDQYQSEMKDKCMVDYYSGRYDLGISIYAPETDDSSENPKINAAYISDGGFHDNLNESCDNVFYLLRSYYTIKEQLELLQEVLRWYDVNFVSPELEVDKDIFDSLREFNHQIRQILDASATSEKKEK
jgi:hypothetical protein